MFAVFFINYLIVMIISIKDKKYKKIMAFSVISALAVLIVLLSISRALFAKVTRPCANCHTMHNSQNGSPVASGGPYDVLLVNTCLGCHSSSSTSTYYTLGGCNVPVVLYTGGEPANYLAGGNFYWVKAGLGDDDTKGHNVFLGEPDDNLTNAPGTSVSCGFPTTNCHAILSSINTEIGTRQGCTKCHMIGTGGAPKGYHHLDDSGPLIDSAAEGWYRFLDGHMSGTGSGVTGIEDNDWQATNSSSDHNEYLGFSATKTSAGNFSNNGDTMTGYCCGCHGNFHIEQSGSSWVRHPSDAVIPTYGEYASAFGASGGTGTYDPNVPVARPDLSTGSWPSSTVTLGDDGDMVMCLSCHRAHGSPYPDMLRWDYSAMLAGGGGDSGGCFTCHTQKNQSP
jgi:predicted CXXCH cytochrome family protein